MELISAMLPNMPPEILEALNQNTGMSYEQRQQQKCDKLNSEPGNLQGYDCPDCLNRGFTRVIKDGDIIIRECACKTIRRSLKRIDQSGLSDMMTEHTLDSFIATDDWQKALKGSAQDFLKSPDGKWFFAGGQVGAGKTHICTAIVGALLNQGYSARYMLWRDESVRLKAIVNDDVLYARGIEPLKTVDVLYIDDFFKTPRGDDGPKPPTPGDINIAFELLNSRYNNKSMITVISSEHNIDDLIDIDQSVGSRIYQRAKGFCNAIDRNINRNYRMKG
jgi:DNA replication protein DnaC